ncbi:hypothetical protein [Echinimonas agarilytica]|uniref:Uncharacterized protein n=1 Tax=Echinimonas agarilytica TaxID=1215918 RepID=A0AA41W7L3_9GAMM|nr:hypothetical protein [Echinimonas agarilytica]MCM2680023.1 hypothetical protein [Echinimonas agarilytica]
MKVRNQSIIFLLVVFITFGLVKGVNLVTLEYMNSNSEYKKTHESKFEKGYLTEKESGELKGLEQAYINDSKARAERQNIFYGTLLVGMSIFLLLSFFLSKVLLIKGSTLIVTSTVLVTAFFASSLWQSLFWGMFFYAGVWLGQRGKKLDPS